MAAACLTFSHLFSFQVSYAELPVSTTAAISAAGAGRNMIVDAASAAATLAMGFMKKKLIGGGDTSDVVLKRGILQVDFTAGLFSLADKDKPIASEPFQSFKRKFAGDGDLLISLHFQGSDCWDVTTQNMTEKKALNHLLECISRKLPLEQTIKAGKDKGLIGIDKSIMKAGLLSRKAKTAYKVDERFIVLVPGKLLLFKGPDISSKRVRYVTTLARARVEATHGQPSFQILVPNTKALSLAAASVGSTKEWILALEDSIEIANGHGNTKDGDASSSDRIGGDHRQLYDELYSAQSNRLQNLELADRVAISSVRSGPRSAYNYPQPADQSAGYGRQAYIERRTSDEEIRSTEYYNMGDERSDPNYEHRRPNYDRFIGNSYSNRDTAQSPASYPDSRFQGRGRSNDGVHNIRNDVDSSYIGEPLKRYTHSDNASSSSFERRDAANATRLGAAMGREQFSQGRDRGVEDPYTNKPYDHPYYTNYNLASGYNHPLESRVPWKALPPRSTWW